MAGGLTADDDVVLVSAEFTPDGLGRVLREATEVDELARRGDLSEGGTISLSNNGKLATVGAGPTPGRRSLAGGRAKVGVALEVVEVDLVALKSVVGIARDDLGNTVNARNGALLSEAARVLGRLHLSSLSLAIP